MRPLTVDSSVFVSALSRNENNTVVSREFFESIKKKQIEIIIPITIVLEVDNITQRFSLSQKEILHEKFLEEAIKLISIDNEFLERYWIHAGKFDLKTADLIVALVSFYENSTLVSWDKKLIKGTKNFCRSKTPREFLES